MRFRLVADSDEITNLFGSVHSSVVSWRGALYVAGRGRGLVRVDTAGSDDLQMLPQWTLTILTSVAVTYVFVHQDQLYCGNGQQLFEVTE